MKIKNTNYQNNPYWFIYTDPSIKLDDSAGKFIAYVRCKEYTTEKERLEFFIIITELLKTNYSLPVAGKIAHIINQNNLIAFLFYCNESEKDLLKSAIHNIKPLLPLKYQSWFQPSPDAKILTWNFRWKSNQQTIDEVKNQTHWTYRVGLRQKK